MLREGGNAVDAAVTTALCQGVLNPMASGVGGGHFTLIRCGWQEVDGQAGGTTAAGCRCLQLPAAGCWCNPSAAWPAVPQAAERNR